MRTEGRWAKGIGREGIGGNCNEPTCYVKDKELNE